MTSVGISFIVFHYYVSTDPLTDFIEHHWMKLIQVPFFRLHKWMRYSMGWLAVLGLYFGAAYGTELAPGSTYKTRTISLLGVFVFQAFFYITSQHRKAVNWSTIMVSLTFQMVIALFVLKSSVGYDVFNFVATLAALFLEFANPAAAFFFSTAVVAENFFFINTLAAIIWFIAFISLLSYWGVMSWLIEKFAWVFFKTMGISGVEAVVAAASPFVGQGGESMDGLREIEH